MKQPATQDKIDISYIWLYLLGEIPNCGHAEEHMDDMLLHGQ